MTLEEYLRSEIEYSKGMMFEADDIEGKSYFEGKADALDELLRKLPSFDHEVTLREVHEMCLEHDCNCVSKGKECCLYDDRYCMVNDVSPNNMDVDDIQRRMKEARND